MAAISFGFEEIEDRLRRVRRRHNSFLLQQAVYAAGSFTGLAGALLIALALLDRAVFFRVAFWASVSLAIPALVLAGLRARKRWISIEQAARLADHRGRLDNRIATLLAQRTRPRRSRLAGVLLAQTLARGADWEIGKVVPRRIPHTLYMLLLSLAIATGTVLLQRALPPTAPLLLAGKGTGRDLIAEHFPGTLEAADVTRPRAGHPASPRAGADGRGDRLAMSDTPRAAKLGAQLRAHHGLVGPRSFAGSARKARPPGTRHEDRVAERVQDMIRRAFGMPGLRSHQPPHGSARRANRTNTSSAKDRSAPRHGAVGGGSESARKNAGGATSKGGGHGHSGPSAGGVGQPVAPGSGLYSRAQPKPRAQAAPKKFSLRLSGILPRLRTEMAPQLDRKSAPVHGAIAGGPEPPAPFGHEGDSREDVLYKAPIAPEYEALIRRIFRR